MLRKGILDSALAANYMAGDSRQGRFRILLLQQRYAIYNKLGWTTEAADIRDSIHALPEYRTALLVPDMESSIESEYKREHTIADTVNPWNSAPSLYSSDNSYLIGAGMRAAWRIPREKEIWGFGIAGSALKKTYDLSAENKTDSADITGSLFTSLSAGLFMTTAGVSLHKRIDDSVFIGGNLEYGFIGSGSSVPVFWTGGSVQITTEGKPESSQFWLFGSLQRYIGRMVSLNVNLFSNICVENANVLLIDKTAHVFYAEDARLQYPVFYTDATYIARIDTSIIRLVTGALKNDILSSGHDSTTVMKLKIPNSNILAGPKFSISFAKFLPVNIGFSWKTGYYWEKYEWDEIITDAQYLVYSRSDGKYYKIPYDPLMVELTPTTGTNGGIALSPAIESGSLETVHHALTRIDNTAAVDADYRIYNGKMGSVNLRTAFSRTWSSLDSKIPIDIPDWTLSASLEWKFRFLNRYNRI